MYSAVHDHIVIVIVVIVIAVWIVPNVIDTGPRIVGEESIIVPNVVNILASNATSIQSVKLCFRNRFRPEIATVVRLPEPPQRLVTKPTWREDL